MGGRSNTAAASCSDPAGHSRSHIGRGGSGAVLGIGKLSAVPSGAVRQPILNRPRARVGRSSARQSGRMGLWCGGSSCDLRQRHRRRLVCGAWAELLHPHEVPGADSGSYERERCPLPNLRSGSRHSPLLPMPFDRHAGARTAGEHRTGGTWRPLRGLSWTWHVTHKIASAHDQRRTAQRCRDERFLRRVSSPASSRQCRYRLEQCMEYSSSTALLRP